MYLSLHRTDMQKPTFHPQKSSIEINRQFLNIFYDIFDSCELNKYMILTSGSYILEQCFKVADDNNVACLQIHSSFFLF